MVSFPNVKINLGLNIVEKRYDGYHNIESVFYPIQYNDILEILKSDKFEFINTGIKIDCSIEQNLCYKAWKLIDNEYNIGPVKIILHKNVPYGSGLGAGSSDAAFTIMLLNNLFNLKLSEEEQIKTASKLGADCAFFIKNKPILAIEKGDIFRNIEISLKDYYIVLCLPNISVKTAEAYSNCIPRKPDISIPEILKMDIHCWKNYLKNDFEDTVFVKYPKLKKIKEELYNNGSIIALMSGSGSVVYGIFDDEPKNLKLNFECDYKIFKLQ